jgi:cytoskeletal protein RodZ
MPTVPELLRTAREKAGLTTSQVAEATKLKSDQIIAIESGQYEVFPAPVYLRGSIRTYAKVLKLESATLLRQLDAELEGEGVSTDPPPLTPDSGGWVDTLMLQISRLNWWIIAVCGVVVAAMVVLWIVFRPGTPVRNQDPYGKLGPGLYTPKQGPRAGELLPLNTNQVPPGR